ncbi:MAG: septum formation initiator family protein [Melioribacteraceae bacterium]|nr:septum formation initiator family protein [Melioribacteraceae bacterium]
MKSKLIFKIIIAVLIISSSIFLYFNENGFKKFLKTKQELQSIEDQIQKNEAEIFRLKNEIDSLNNSKTKIEKVAREKFHMSKKNEKVFLIEEK